MSQEVEAQENVQPQVKEISSVTFKFSETIDVIPLVAKSLFSAYIREVHDKGHLGNGPTELFHECCCCQGSTARCQEIVNE